MSILQESQNRQPPRVGEDDEFNEVRRISSKSSLVDESESSPPSSNIVSAVDDDHVDHDSSEEQPQPDEMQAPESESTNVTERIADGDSHAGNPHQQPDAEHIQSDSSDANPDTQATDHIVVEYYVPNIHVGRIIGRRGQTISDIQQRSGALVDVPQHSDPGSDYRRIQIGGNQEQVDCCIVLIQLQLPLQSQEEINNLYHNVLRLQQKNNDYLAIVNIDVPMAIVGRIIGRKGLYLRQLKESTGATVVLPRFSTGVQSQVFTVMGNAEEVQKCTEVLTTKIRDCQLTNAASTYYPFAAPQHRQPQPNQQHDHREATIIYVPNEHVGRVIGRKGAHIKELQGQSGAKIYLPGETSSDMPFRRMRIHGTPEQRHRCYQLLLQKVPYLEQAPIELINTNGAYAPQVDGSAMMTQMFSRMDLAQASPTQVVDPRQPPLMFYPMEQYPFAGPYQHGQGQVQMPTMMSSPMLTPVSPTGIQSFPMSQSIPTTMYSMSPHMGSPGMDAGGFRAWVPHGSPHQYSPVTAYNGTVVYASAEDGIPAIGLPNPSMDPRHTTDISWETPVSISLGNDRFDQFVVNSAPESNQ